MLDDIREHIEKIACPRDDHGFALMAADPDFMQYHKFATVMAKKVLQDLETLMETHVLVDRKRMEAMRTALEKLRDCDWVISLPDRMDAVRDIARKALEEHEEQE